jgi:hypothetical protein
MLDLLNLLRDKNYHISIRSAFEELGADRTQFYRWADVPGFSEWWKDQAERHFARHVPQVYGAMHRAAVSEDGCAADRKLMLDKFDPAFQAKDSGPAPAAVTVRVDVLEIMRQMLNAIQMVPGSDCLSASAVRRLPAEADVIDVEAEDQESER